MKTTDEIKKLAKDYATKDLPINSNEDMLYSHGLFNGFIAGFNASQSKPQEIPEENRQKLFNHMSTEHGLTLLESEMNSIYSICIGHEEYVKYLNWLHSKPVDTKTVDAIDPTFWRRLEMFVSNIQVNDMAGEEEKQYIIHVIESKK